MKNNKKRLKCLTPSELSYLLLISSVVTGCSQSVDKLPDYKTVLDMCKSNPQICQEQDKLDQLAQNPSWSGSGGTFTHNNGINGNNHSFFNYYLMYHLLFSKSGPSNPGMYSNKFNNYTASDLEKDKENYRGRGVYSPGFVNRIHSEVAAGRTAVVTKDGQVMKSSSFKGTSKSSLTGKTISRGGFGSSGRSFGVHS